MSQIHESFVARAWNSGSRLAAIGFARQVNRPTSRPREAFSVLELMLVLVVIGILLALLIPALLSARSLARRSYCSNNLRQISIGLISYESAHRTMPPGRLTPDFVRRGELKSAYTNYSEVHQRPHVKDWLGFRSVHLLLLPHLDQASIGKRVDFRIATTQRMTKSGVPVNANYEAYASYQSQFLCPADVPTQKGVTENNYRYNFGGSTPYAGALDVENQTKVHWKQRDLSSAGNGAFTISRGLSRTSFKDGLSTTVAFSERTRGKGGKPGKQVAQHSDIISMPRRTKGMLSPDEMFDRCGNVEPRRSIFHFHASGSWLLGSDFSNGWPFAAYSCTMYNHVAPPNWSGYDCGSWSSIPDTPGEHAIVSARSEHSHGVNAAFADAHVEFISDQIDVKTWRQIGTRNGQ